MAFDAGFIDVYLNGVRLVNGTSDCTVTSGSSIVLASGATAGDVLEAVAFGTFNLASISINDLTDVTTGGVSDGQVLVYNNSASRFQPGAMLVLLRFMVLIYRLLHQQLIIQLLFNL